MKTLHITKIGLALPVDRIMSVNQFIASIQTKYVSSNLLSVSLNQSSFRNLGNLSGFTIAAKQKKEECMSPGVDVYGYIVIEY